MVRIHLPPALSHRRTGPAASGFHIPGYRRGRVVLHRPVERQNLSTHQGQSGTAAPDPTFRRLDHRLAEAGAMV